ncbi:MAG TPA: hypothetical protein VGG11_20890 [Xanthobacteraceae bacterium]
MADFLSATQAQDAWVAAVNRQNTRRNFTRRLALAIATLGCVPAVLAQAQGNIPERELKAAAGRDLRVGVYTDIRPDCTSGPLPAIKLAAPPAHGGVTVKRGTLRATNIKQCLATEAPAFVAFYRAAPDFRGSDQFALEITWPDGRKQLQRFRIDVANTGRGEGI